MPPSTLFCPRCGAPLTVPHPAPEEVACPKCRAAVRTSSAAKVGAATQPASHRPTAARDAHDAFQRPTELAHHAPMPTAPGRFGVLLAAAACLLVLVAGAAAVGVWAMSSGAAKDKNNGADAKNDGKAPPAPSEPRVLIDEDFSKAAADRQTLPDGWTGDSFRVVKDHDEACLAVSKPRGEFFVKAPPVTLSGDFSIEVACIVDATGLVIVRLESRKTNALFPVSVSHAGHVAIVDDARLAPPNFKPYSPMLFLLKREGKKLRVFLNGEVVADKDLDAATEFESLQLGMAGGAAVVPGGSKVFRLKVATLAEK